MKIAKLALLASSTLFSLTILAQDVVTGTESVYLTHMNAYQLNGSRDDDDTHNTICQTRFSWISEHAVDLEYNINTRTGIQYATANLLNNSVDMLPMGILNTYSFLSQRGIPDALETYYIKQIYFKLNTEFELQDTTISFIDKSLDFQCIAQTADVNAR